MRKARGVLPEERDVARAVFFGSIEHGGIHRRVSKGGGGVRHLPGKNSWGSLSLSETDPSLSLAAPRPRDRGHYGRRIHLDPSLLRSPKHYGKRQGPPDWPTMTGKARHPPYRRGAFGVRPHQMVLSARPGRCAGSVLPDHLVAARQGEGAR